MKKIRPLIWDSDFFEKRVGIIELEYGEEVDFEQYDIVYVFSDYDSLPYKLVDKKVTYLLNIENFTFDSSNINFYNSSSDNYDEILSLALQSGVHSRFKIDEKFRSNEYEKLYKEWLDKSISREIALEVLVKRINGKIVGFATVGSKTTSLADIGLVAVDYDYRGMGIGKEILNNAILFAKLKNFKEIQVVTQLDNLAATLLYEKVGFEQLKIKYIYHVWNPNTF